MLSGIFSDNLAVVSKNRPLAELAKDGEMPKNNVIWDHGSSLVSRHRWKVKDITRNTKGGTLKRSGVFDLFGVLVL
jgi:hypothetical protein